MLADMMSFCWHNWMGPIAVCGTLPSVRISYNYLFGDPKWNWVITVNIIILFTIKDGIRKNAIAFPKLGQTVCNRAISHWPTAAASSSSRVRRRRGQLCGVRVGWSSTAEACWRWKRKEGRQEQEMGWDEMQLQQKQLSCVQHWLMHFGWGSTSSVYSSSPVPHLS